MLYLLNQAKDFGAAKDIRIFGLRTWLEELYEKNLEAFLAFHRKAEGVYLWARNCRCYSHLFAKWTCLCIPDLSGISAGDGCAGIPFIVSPAVDGFSSWVLGILDGFRTLHKQSLDISTIRECLDYPEIFSFTDGIPLKWETQKSYEILH